MLIFVAFLLIPLAATADADVHLPSNRKIDCSDKENSFYVIGCNTNFTRCYEQKRYEMSCPETLFFDSLRGKCEFKENVKECQNAKAFKDALLKTPSEFNCTDRKDGSYVHPEVPCDNFYYTCVHSTAVQQNCPYQQYFDEKKQRCDFKNRVESCKNNNNKKISGLVEDLPSPPPSYGYPNTAEIKEVSSDAPPSPPSKPTEKEEPIEEVPIKPTDRGVDCKTVGDGVFRDSENKCAKFFWKCSNDKLFKYRCQLGLFYDADADRCDHMQYIPDCGGKRPATTVAPAMDATPVDFDCKDKEDDYYVKEKCPEEFYHCNGGVARAIRCNAHLVYDVRIKACDYPEACRAVRTTEAPPLVGEHGSSQVAHAPEEKINFDCTEKDDGMYAMEKCIEKYIQCTAAKAYSMKCPTGLVFNESEKQCDYKESCLRQNSTLPREPTVSIPTTTTTSSPTVAGGYGQPETAADVSSTTTSTSTSTSTQEPTTVPTTTTTTATSTSSGSEEKISCANLENGAHAVEECSADYVECWDGAATPSSCAHGLMFNTYNGQCDYRDNVPGCNVGKKFVPSTTTPAADKVAPTAEPTTAAPTETTESGIPTRPAPIDPYCERLADGFYGSGCNAFFYSCSRGATYKMECPGGLFYDTDAQRCNNKDEIVACGAKPKTLQSKPTKPNTSGYSGVELESTVPKKPENVAPTTRPALPARGEEKKFDCQGKKDGLYALSECTATFIQCWNDQTIPNECQSGLFYNDANGMCDYKENVPVCGGRLPITPKPTTAPIEKKEMDSGKQLSLCTGQKDGYYSTGCSSDYYSCDGGMKKKMRCPSQLRFSQSLRRCDFASYVSECDADATESTSTTTTTPVPVTQAQSTVEDFSMCDNKPFGFYPASPCSADYISCQNGLRKRGKCPADLIFNGKTGICDYVMNVASCSAPSPPVLEQPLASSAPEAQEGSRIMFSCQGVRDGFYPTAPCSAAIIQCSNQMALEGSCPEGLVFNSRMNYCDRRERVSQCAALFPADIPVTAAPAPLPLPSYGQQLPAPLPAYGQLPQAPPAQAIFTCIGKPDGIYGYACRTKFWRCMNGASYEHTCSTGLLFDLSSGKCNYPAYVQGC